LTPLDCEGLYVFIYFLLKFSKKLLHFVAHVSSCDVTLKYLSVYGSGRQLEPAAEFINYILQRADEEGKEVYKKVSEIIEEGKARGSLRLEGFEKKVEVGGREHVVKIIGGGAQFERSGTPPPRRIGRFQTPTAQPPTPSPPTTPPAQPHAGI
jgi:hypothetical protein